LPNSEFVVAANREEALELAHKTEPALKIDDLRQDEDVLDTWFSSWLWPISVFDGIRHPDNPDIRYYFPTGDLVTAPDIIFFWVARMIMASFEYRKDVPFRNVYFTGTVRDKLGRKMSKSLGNSPEPIELINKYGADAVRIGMLLCSPAGNDLLYDNNLVEQGRNFCNKVWNAMRLVKGWEIDQSLPQPHSAEISVSWFASVLNAALTGITEQFERYRLSEALKDIYKLVWDDFCSWYLEMIKPGFKQPIDPLTYQATLDFFEGLIRIMHPFMPFITEEIYHVLHNSGEDSIMKAEMPVAGSVDEDLVREFDFIRDLIIAVRSVRSEQNIQLKESISLFIRREKSTAGEHAFDETVIKLCNLKELHYSMEKPADAVSFIVRTTECYIPLTQSINIEEELVKLNDEIAYQRGFLESIMKKLENQSFINGAPQKVIEGEMRKKADTESRIAALEERIRSLRE
jgi:valyl-tRNA synthetase